MNFLQVNATVLLRARHLRILLFIMVIVGLILPAWMAVTAENELDDDARDPVRERENSLLTGDFLSLAIPLLAQANTKPQYTITVEVKLVNLFVTVSDRKGRSISNLIARDFRLWEDDVPQEITHFATWREAPLSIAILLDVSGSMALANKYELSLEALASLAAGLGKDDEVALFTFSDNVVSIMLPFTTEKDMLFERLKPVKPFGKTALYWAIETMPRIMGKPKNRQAIVLLTDGIDNMSEMPLEDVLDSARRTRIPIYTIGYSFSSIPKQKIQEDYTRVTILRTIADSTGGIHLPVDTPSELPAVVERIISELRFQYLLGYRSNQKPEPGSYHRIKLQTRRKNDIVKVRKGYYVSP